ncbi:MAG TPA: hypothetical protein VFN48_11585 [Solirubrobacteraceae bacterium]|nr:hypothetical protein [Solirubrobacteraceae bacterium]
MPALSADEARARFLAARVARQATAPATAADYPQLVPIIFAAIDADTLVCCFDRPPGTRAARTHLEHLGTGPRMSLIVDEYTEDWSTLWWARADVRVSLLDPDRSEERPARDAAVAALVAKYEQYRDAPPEGPATQMTVERWAGWSARA